MEYQTIKHQERKEWFQDIVEQLLTKISLNIFVERKK